MGDALLLVACVLPIVALTRASYSRQGVEVNHVAAFSAGFLFYWVFPIALGRVRLLADDPALRIWYAYFDATARPEHLHRFLLFAVLILAAFLLGSHMGGRLPRGRTASAPTVLGFAPALLPALLPLALGITAIYGWQLRSQLFSGYAHTGADAARGPLSAASLILLAVLLLHRAHTAPHHPWSRSWGWAYASAYGIAALLLLSVGGRLYVATAGVVWLTFRTVYEARFPPRRVTVLLIAAVLGVGAVGVMRSSGRLSALGIAANVFSEPLFTSFSMLHFIGRGDFPLWNVPRFLLGDLINLIPSAVFPGKASLLVRPEDYGYVVYAPVGALSAFFSLMINFGLIGSMLAVFALGLVLSFLRRFQAPLFHVVYAMLSGWLAFAFFRDPFSISLVKNMFEFSVVVPIGIAAALHVVTVATTGERRLSSRPARDA